MDLQLGATQDIRRSKAEERQKNFLTNRIDWDCPLWAVHPVTITLDHNSQLQARGGGACNGMCRLAAQRGAGMK